MNLKPEIRRLNTRYLVRVLSNKPFSWVFLISLFAFPTMLFGQSRNQEVTIIGQYQPTISDAFKINIAPSIKDTMVEMPNFTYFIQSNPIVTSYSIDPLEPVFLDIDPDEILRRNYLRAGYGNYATPMVEFFTNSLRSDKFSLGFHAKHISSTGQIEDNATSKYSKNDISLYAKRYLKNKVLSGKIYYKRDVVHYYGFNPADIPSVEFSDDDLKQKFSLIGANTGIESNYKRNKKLNYQASLNFYNLSDIYETSETFVGLKTNINGVKEYFNFVEEQELGADFEINYYNNQDSINSQGTLISNLKPYLKIQFDYFNLYLGVKGAVSADSSTEFHIYPAIKASYQVIPDYLRFYISASGGLDRNSYKSVTDINPWVNPTIGQKNTNTKYEIKGGVNGRLNMLIDYNFSVSYADVQDMLFFVNDYSPFSPETALPTGVKFIGIYDDAQVTTVSAGLSYEQAKKLNIMFSADYRNYTLKQEAKPWHKPAFTATLGAKYFFTDKISASGNLFYNSKIYALVSDGQSELVAERDGFIDINLGAEYRFTDRISVFLNLNNITATRYYRWYNYPSQRFNMMGGVTFSF
nr:TonB-dependent receptor [Bacteroidota bacterium]